MASLPETFVLRTSLTSPFGRKVRMAVDVLGLSDRVTLLSADPLDENDTLRWQNPLGKMPCLLRGDGSAIYDSGIIIEFLQDVAGTDRLLPKGGAARFKALTRSRLADGIIDASILVVYDSRFRPGEPPVGTLAGASARQDHARPCRFRDGAARPGKRPISCRLALSCALGYLDWRKPVDWRAAAPGLVAWLQRSARTNRPSSAHARPIRKGSSWPPPIDPPPHSPGRQFAQQAEAEAAARRLRRPRPRLRPARANFPLAARYTPSDAPKETLFALHEISRHRARRHRA